MVLKIYLYALVHSSHIDNNQEVEAIQMSIYGWMDKQNMIYAYNRILSSLKKGENPVTCYNMCERWRHYGK